MDGRVVGVYLNFIHKAQISIYYIYFVNNNSHINNVALWCVLKRNQNEINGSILNNMTLIHFQWHHQFKSLTEVRLDGWPITTWCELVVQFVRLNWDCESDEINSSLFKKKKEKKKERKKKKVLYLISQKVVSSSPGQIMWKIYFHFICVLPYMGLPNNI